MTVLIAAAMPAELQTVRRRLQGGLFGDRRVELLATGDGAANARRQIGPALERVRASHLLVLGVSGGLTPNLRTGDLIAGQAIRDLGAKDRCFEAAPEGLAAASIPVGTLVQSPVILGTAAQKATAAVMLQAERAAVDLESAEFAGAADDLGIPWLVVRCISDAFDEDFPLDFERCRPEPGGSVSRSRVVRALMGRPGALPGLLRLQGRVTAASRRLADAAEGLLPRWVT